MADFVGSVGRRRRTRTGGHGRCCTVLSLAIHAAFGPALPVESYRYTIRPRRVVGEEEKTQAIFWFWFVFGAATGMAALPHLQRIAARARQTLAELDQPKQPSSGS